jgi:glycosyltransferase involved in cell wall biosynthesis
MHHTMAGTGDHMVTDGPPLRICLIPGDSDPRRCGVADYTQQLARHLNEVPGLHTTVVPVRPPGQRRITSVGRMLRTILQHSPDVAHFQWPSRAYERTVTVFGLPLAIKLLGRGPRQPRPAVVMTFHESTAPTLAWNIRYAIALLGADGVIRVTEEVVLAPCQQRIANRLPSTIVPIGSNITLSPDDTTELPPDISQLRETVGVLLVFFGLLTPEKQLERILATIRPHLDVGLAIIGGTSHDNGYLEKLRHTIAEMHMGDRTVLTGWLPSSSVSRALQAADAVVLPNARLNSGAYLAAVQHDRPVLVANEEPGTETARLGSRVLTLREALTRGVREAIEDWREHAAPPPPLLTWPDIARRHAHFYRKVLRRQTAGP